MRQKIFIFIWILVLSFSVFGASYNSSYSNLTLEKNGWCTNIPITFKLYNQTEFELYKSDDEFNFTLISSPLIKIYSGPLSSLPLLVDTTATDTGEYTYTFTSQNSYLVEIKPTGDFNDYEELIEIDECRFSNPNLIITNTSVPIQAIKLYNSTFLYTDVKVSLKDTTIQSKDSITVKNIENIVLNGLAPLNNVKKTFSLQGLNQNYSELDIEVSLISMEEGKTVKGYHYQNDAWISKDIEVYENKVTFKNTNYGIYSITFESNSPQLIESNSNLNLESNTVINPNLDNTAPLLENNIETQTTNSENNNPNLETEETVSSQNNNSNTMYIIISLIVISLGFGLYKLSQNQKVDTTNTHSEILNSYNEIYSHTKTYVQRYKEEYGKDQIYRALETVNVPRDIIDKVFLEEFQ